MSAEEFPQLPGVIEEEVRSGSIGANGVGELVRSSEERDCGSTLIPPAGRDKGLVDPQFDQFPVASAPGFYNGAVIDTQDSKRRLGTSKRVPRVSRHAVQAYHLSPSPICTKRSAGAEAGLGVDPKCRDRAGEVTEPKVDIFFRFVDDERTMVALDVIIVTYNSAEYLPRVLGSLPDWVDAIVVDNASSDDSAELAR